MNITVKIPQIKENSACTVYMDALCVPVSQCKQLSSIKNERKCGGSYHSVCLFAY